MLTKWKSSSGEDPGGEEIDQLENAISRSSG